MIKATELRIGNFIGKYNPSRVVAITGANSDSVHFVDADGDKFGEYETDIEPIILTDEILEKSGFEKEGYYWGDYYSNKHLQLMKNKTGEGYFLLNGEDVVYWNKVYLYVHELQNLHFILTGEELEIKL